MSDSTNQRKLEHLRIATEETGADRNRLWTVHLIHRALPEIKPDDVDTSCTFLGKTLSFPFLISSMTGGDVEQLLAINRTLPAPPKKPASPWPSVRSG